MTKLRLFLIIKESFDKLMTNLWPKLRSLFCCHKL